MHSKQNKIMGLATLAFVALFAIYLLPVSKPEVQPDKPGSSARAIKIVAKPAAKKKSRQPQPDKEAVQAPAILFPEPTTNTIEVIKEPELAKLDSYQNPVKENSDAWDCVIDRTTGLVWEVKTNDHGLQDSKNYYSWFEPRQALIGSDPGRQDNGNCRGGIDCDTSSYINAINSAKLCGYSDWRLPTRKELLSLVQHDIGSKNKGLINPKFFPHGSVDWYWSADSDADDASNAWYVLFYNGRAMKAAKTQAKRIRLVRGGEAKRSFKNYAEHPGDDDAANKKLASETDSMLRVIKPEATPAS